MSQTPEIITRAFTTWAALYQQLLDDLASGGFGKIQSYSLSTSGSTRTFNYRSYDEFLKLLNFTKDQAALESGLPPFHGRTLAGNGGRC